MSLAIAENAIAAAPHHIRRASPNAASTTKPWRYDPLLVLGCLDQTVLLLSGSIWFLILGDTRTLPFSIAAILAVAALVFVLTAYGRKLYSYVRMETAVRQMMPFAFTLFQTGVCTCTLIFLLRPPFPFLPQWLALWGGTMCVAMLALRFCFWLKPLRAARAAFHTRKIILVGVSDNALSMIHHLGEYKGRYEIVGLFATGPCNRDAFTVSGIPVIDRFERLEEYCRERAVDDIIITPEPAHDIAGEDLLKMLEVLPCTIKYCIPGGFFSRPLAEFELVSHIPVVTIFHTPLKGASLKLKRAEDIIVSLVLILLSSPLMLLAALAIVTDGSGRIIFRQKRHGFGGAEFDIFKFRSMKIRDDENIIQATRRDHRITWVGKILRRTSIDELPQLFNVLKGDMSIVGPRPHAVIHNFYYKELIEGYAARQRIKPGITGWAQVNGWRGQTDTIEKMQKRIEHDLYYVENWSLWFDLKLILLTGATCLFHKNAY